MDDRIVQPRAGLPFQDVPHAEFLSHFFGVEGFALVGESSAACDHETFRNSGKIGADIFGQPVSQIPLLLVSAHVLEWEHRDRRLVRQR